MKIIQQLTTKPWLTEQDAPSGVVSLPPAKVGLVVFLAVVTVLFSLFVTAYFIRMEIDDWRPLPEPSLLWLNTLMLMCGSIAFQIARVAIERELMDRVKIFLLAGGVFTFIFLAGQLWAWQTLSNTGYFLSANPANAFFYLITGLHGLHMLGGLWVWVKTISKVWHGVEPEKLRLSIELCTVYWHYLLLIWLVLFGLLLST